MSLSFDDSQLSLLLFNTNVRFALDAQKAGINSVIVDWESKGKEKRQVSRNTR